MAAVACSGALSAAIDLRTRRVPNAATAAIAAAGLGFAAAGVSGHSIGGALAGMTIGFVLMLPGHVLGATGAGDVKLLAAMGTLLGPAAIFYAFLYTAIAGGVLATAVAVRRRRFGDTLDGVASLVQTRGASAQTITSPTRNNRFAYAPAIAVGTLLAALGV